MKTTRYFSYTRTRSDRADIKDKWIQQVINRPSKSSVQTDGRIRKWGWIEEAGRFLRVILLADGETVHNAFWDRSYKEE